MNAQSPPRLPAVALGVEHVPATALPETLAMPPAPERDTVPIASSAGAGAFIADPVPAEPTQVWDNEGGAASVQ